MVVSWIDGYLNYLGKQFIGIYLGWLQCCWVDKPKLLTCIPDYKRANFSGNGNSCVGNLYIFILSFPMHRNIPLPIPQHNHLLIVKHIPHNIPSANLLNLRKRQPIKAFTVDLQRFIEKCCVGLFFCWGAVEVEYLCGGMDFEGVVG